MDEEELCRRLQQAGDLSPQEWEAAMQGWGYRLLDRPHAHSPGHRILLVALRDAPTHEHYDPESVDLCLLASNDLIEHTRLTRSASRVSVPQVCPGNVLLMDRVRKEVNFFTYGATLDWVPLEALTVCVFRSPAPILEMEEDWSPFPAQLGAESAALLAEVRARWGLDRAGYARRLAQVSGDALYLATLRSIVARYRQSPALRENFPNFYRAVTEELAWQQASGTGADGPTLEVLLAPGE